MKKAPHILTKRLTLRPILPTDSQNITYLLHPKIQEHAGPYMPHSLEDLTTHIQRITSSTSWLIELNGKVIGDIGVFSTQDNRTGEMAWYLDPDHWQSGYSTEAGLAVINYMFTKLGYGKLTAPICGKNTASRRLAEKLGFTHECIKPNSELYGVEADVHHYLITN